MKASRGRWTSAIKNFSGSLPLQVKLILSFVLVIFIPVLLFAWYAWSGVSSRSIQELTKKNESILDIEKTNIQNNVEVMEWTAQLALSNREMNDYLELQEEMDTAWLLDFKNKTYTGFQYFLFNNPRIANVRLFTSNPNVHEFWPVVLNESRIREKPWYDKVMEQRGIVWWEIQLGREILKGASTVEEIKVPHMSLLREFTYADGTHNGIMEVSMEVRHFFTKTFSTVQDPSSQLIVVSRGGSVYTDSSAAIFSETSSEQLMAELQLTGEERNGISRFEMDGHSYMAIQTFMPRLGIHLVNLVGLDDTLADIQRTRNLFIVIIVVLMAVLSLLSYFMHSIILKRLRILRDSMKKVRGGDLHVDVQVRGNDEVGELAHHYRQLLKKINELIVEQVNRQAAGKEAELRSLKNQIDSHFLYNTLENLKMLAEIEGQYTISDALTSLGGMMRYSLQWTRGHVRLRDEVQHIQNYIAIMNIRYDGKLELRLDIAPECYDQEVLKMSLQPLVENAVKHGMNDLDAESGKLTITIGAFVRLEDCVIEVTDNGCGIPEERLRLLSGMLRMEETDYQELRSHAETRRSEGSGIGLRNVDHRLVMSYGREYGLRMESVEGSYTRIAMTLPHLIRTGGDTR
ncbi:two-component system, sensor histidine kinase YesM [Paenibacillaceae bacterium GAS479]|nr:two-component system, sensor histidine kinase YesM [Paenibacillaceae bacterium GAS479]